MPLRTGAHLRGFDILALACAHINDIRDALVFDFATPLTRPCHRADPTDPKLRATFFGATYLPGAKALVAFGYDPPWDGIVLPSGELIVIDSVGSPFDVKAPSFEELLIRRLRGNEDADSLALLAFPNGLLEVSRRHSLAACLPPFEAGSDTGAHERPLQRRHLYTPAFAERVATSLAGALDVGYGA